MHYIAKETRRRFMDFERRQYYQNMRNLHSLGEFLRGLCYRRHGGASEVHRVGGDATVAQAFRQTRGAGQALHSQLYSLRRSLRFACRRLALRTAVRAEAADARRPHRSAAYRGAAYRRPAYRAPLPVRFVRLRAEQPPALRGPRRARVRTAVAEIRFGSELGAPSGGPL